MNGTLVTWTGGELVLSLLPGVERSWAGAMDTPSNDSILHGTRGAPCADSSWSRRPGVRGDPTPAPSGLELPDNPVSSLVTALPVASSSLRRVLR